MALETHLKWIYAAYFIVLYASLAWNRSDDESVGPPVVVLTVLVLHFVLAGLQAWDQNSPLARRYCNDFKWGVLAVVTDVLLIISLGLTIAWTETPSDQPYAISSITTAVMGNTGCFILQFARNNNVVVYNVENE